MEWLDSLSLGAGLEPFMAILQSAGINVTVRASRGAGATAACGQLRAQPA